MSKPSAAATYSLLMQSNDLEGVAVCWEQLASVTDEDRALAVWEARAAAKTSHMFGAQPEPPVNGLKPFPAAAFEARLMDRRDCVKLANG